MPIVNGKYDAPVWVDNAPPALGATELQAISNSVASYAGPFEYVPNIVRPNLLDNWYFEGGGSQQGGGQFPINSTGSTSYTTHMEYTVDKWRLYIYNGSATVALTSSGVNLSGNDASWQQFVYSTNDLLGKQVTLSALVDGDLVCDTATVPSTFNTGLNVILISFTDYNVSLISRTPNAGDGTHFMISIGIKTTTPKLIQAVKLELGNTQTLAHQENGTWVLNEIPNFDEQYMRCATFPAVPTRVEYGSYVGTGTYGSGNPSSITFGFVPKEVHIRSSSDSSTYDFDSVSGMTTTYQSRTITWSGTKMEWYSGSSAAYQMNTNGTTYYYIAFG